MDLLVASQIGDIKRVLQLIKEGVNVDIQNSWEYTPLIIASKYNRLEIVNELIKAGANLDIKNHDGNNALLYASYKGHLDIVEVLIKAGANLNIQNNCGSTALIFICDLKLANELIQKGANTDLINGYDKCVLYNSLENQNYEISNLLLKSIKNFNKECLQFKNPVITFFYLFPFIMRSKKCLINKIPDDLIRLLLKF